MKSFDELPPSLSIKDVAKVMNVSPNTIYTLTKSEGFPVIRTGTRYVIPRDSFLVWWQKQMPAGTKLINDSTTNNSFKEHLVVLLANQQQLLQNIISQQQSTQKLLEELLAN